MNDELFRIECGRCGLSSQLDLWLVEGRQGVFRCPRCGYAFKRQARVNGKPWEKAFELVEVKL